MTVNGEPGLIGADALAPVMVVSGRVIAMWLLRREVQENDATLEQNRSSFHATHNLVIVFLKMALGTIGLNGPSVPRPVMVARLSGIGLVPQRQMNVDRSMEPVLMSRIVTPSRAR